MKQRVLVGMSGGVDSSVSAALLLAQGYEVIGGFMKNWSDGDDTTECSWRDERRDAMRVAAQLGIAFHTFDFEHEYRSLVYEYMIGEYRAGRTPNPDVLCNKYMKFDLFLREADALGCAYVATGHYARVRRDGAVAHLLAGVDVNKDQSYFLCQLTQPQLARVLFPIGDLTKPAVREKARELGLSVAEKKDSQGICFVGRVDMKDFLAARISPHAGNIVTTDGKVLGTHDGFEFYTVGQRGGLGIGGGTPLYVVDRRPATNEVVVALGASDPALFRSTLSASQLTETYPGALVKADQKKIAARIRYRQPLAECEIVFTPPTTDALSATTSAVVTFRTPQRAVAPGQFIAFYNGDELLGSGVIDL